MIYTTKKQTPEDFTPHYVCKLALPGGPSVCSEEKATFHVGPERKGLPTQRQKSGKGEDEGQLECP